MFDRIKKVDGGRRFSKVSTHDPIFIDTLINKKNESIRKSYQPKDDVSDDIQFLDNDSISNKSEELKINIECFPEMEDHEPEVKPIPSNLADCSINESQIVINQPVEDEESSVLAISNSLESISSCSSTSSKVSVHQEFLNKINKQMEVKGASAEELKENANLPIKSYNTIADEK